MYTRRLFLRPVTSSLTDYLQKLCAADLGVTDAEGFLLPYLSQQKSFLRGMEEESCRWSALLLVLWKHTALKV